MTLARRQAGEDPTGQDPTGQDPTGGVAGNERLTAMTGAVLIVLLAVEGFTLLGLHAMLTVHFFIGMLLVGPAALKMGSTGYRFARYYRGAEPYVRKGPPPLILRVLGPLVVITSVGVIGTGVMLAFVGPGPSPWLTLHEVFFVFWFAVMAVHVTWYAPQLPRLLRSGSPHLDRAQAALAGAGRRWLLLTAALAAGLIIAVATYHLSAPWTSPLRHG